jgi:hypothetical protein
MPLLIPNRPPIRDGQTETKRTLQSIMKKHLIIVADLGSLQAYRTTQNRADRQPHLEFIEELKLKKAHQKISDQTSDQAGRFPRGDGAANVSGDLSAGESLNSEAEQDRRLLQLLAKTINTLLLKDDVSGCSLAVSGAIHKQLLGEIDPKARAKIGQVLASNLVHMDPSELSAHFEKHAV